MRRNNPERKEISEKTPFKLSTKSHKYYEQKKLGTDKFLDPYGGSAEIAFRDKAKGFCKFTLAFSVLETNTPSVTLVLTTDIGTSREDGRQIFHGSFGEIPASLAQMMDSAIPGKDVRCRTIFGLILDKDGKVIEEGEGSHE